MNRQEFEELHNNHIRLWDWIYAVDGKKENWPEWEWNGGDIKDVMGHECFACDAVKGDCERCPIKWSNEGTKTCMENDSPFFKWLKGKTFGDRKYWAMVVRDMEWTWRGE